MLRRVREYGVRGRNSYGEVRETSAGVFEGALCPGGTVGPSFLLLISRPTAALVKDYALQLCYAVKYLHDHDISHGDLCVGGMFFILTSS